MKVKKGTPAAKDPLSCAGLILLRVGHTDVSDGLAFDSVLDLLGARPVTLTFEHPWQRKSVGSDEPYYYNSTTEESVWDKPRVLEDVAQAMAMRLRAGGGMVRLLDRFLPGHCLCLIHRFCETWAS